MFLVVERVFIICVLITGVFATPPRTSYATSTAVPLGVAVESQGPLGSGFDGALTSAAQVPPWLFVDGAMGLGVDPVHVTGRDPSEVGQRLAAYRRITRPILEPEVRVVLEPGSAMVQRAGELCRNTVGAKGLHRGIHAKPEPEDSAQRSGSSSAQRGERIT